LFLSFYNQLIFLIKKICGTKTGSQSASLFVTFSSAQAQGTENPESVIIRIYAIAIFNFPGGFSNQDRPGWDLMLHTALISAKKTRNQVYDAVSWKPDRPVP